MRIHHLNALTFCPYGGPLLHLRGMLDWHAEFATHCLLAESEQGLVLVDSGCGSEDVRLAEKRLGREFVAILRPELRAENTLHAQISRLGYKPEDVRHILLTHLDPDHAGGLSDFPRAKVHVMTSEFVAAGNPRTWYEKKRYRKSQWSHAVNWQFYDSAGESWNGFPAVRQLVGLSDDFALIPLAGHSAGHAGFAVRGGKGWLLHCGDAYFYHDEVHEDERTCPVGLDLYQQVGSWDNSRRLANQERLRALEKTAGTDIHIFCAHDAYEFRTARAMQW